MGIGTSSPANKFVVAEATGQHGVEIAPGTTSYIQAYDRATSDYGDLRIDAQTIAFATDNGSERMLIDSSGNVDLKTGGANLKIPYTGNETYSCNLGWRHLQLGNNGGNYIVAGNTATGGSLNFVVNNTTDLSTNNGASHNGTVAMGIDSAGNITTSGNSHMTFGPNSTWGSSIRIGGNGRTATGTEMASVVTTDGNIHIDAANSANGVYLNYYAGTNGTLFGSGAGATVAIMSSAGNLTLNGTVDGRDVALDGTKLDGIETGATADQTAAQILTAIKTVDGAGSGLDADLLDGVQGSSYLRSDTSDTFTGTLTVSGPLNAGATAVTGALTATGDITAYYSDERLKDFDGKIEGALDKVGQLNGYYFRENERAKELGFDNDDLQVGVSAQEVEAVLPEVIKPAPVDPMYKTVQYEKLVPLLIEAIKELKAEVDELKAVK